MRRLVPVLVALTALVAAAAPPRAARACGGFFCNAVSQTPVIQAGERVLFARTNGLVTMHIEVTYQGDPTQFGWILPVPDPPKDASGRPLPLDRAVAVSSLSLFPTLQSATDPIFSVQNTFASDGSICSATSGSARDASTVADYYPSADAGNQPPVVVLESAKVGPYDAQLIHADSADALYTWLGDNGYQQDPAARPLLGTYIDKGYDFIGIRLQSGKQTDDLRPLAITLGEDAPCVPLRLTSIAATPDMPILVWVLGSARAVPKNFIHARLNDMAMSYPGAPGYQALVSQAIDTASGRAWVTEFAGPTAPFRDFLNLGDSVERDVARADSALQLVQALGAATSDPDVLAALRAGIPMPAGLRGYPYGNCYACEGCDPTYCPEADADHVTTDGEFYGYLTYWLGRADAPGLAVDLAALKARFADEVFAPRHAIDALFASTQVMTRFYTTLDPQEMTRDPIFAFNPDLPMVDRSHVINTVVHSGPDCSSWVDITYPDGRTWRQTCPGGAFACGSIAPVPGEEALLWPEVLDETGAGVPFSTTQIHEVDRLMDGAAVGAPTLPASFAVIPAESPTQPVKPRAPGATVDDGCAGGAAGPEAGLWGVAAAVGLGLAGRRKRTLPARAGLL